jgi:flagellar biosynthesis anti-sigma factor FlgM
MTKRKNHKGRHRQVMGRGLQDCLPALRKEALEDARLERLAQKAREVVAAAPEVRAEKVAALKEAIRQGAYRPDARKVALKLIKELLLEEK